jgi:hypothetical protein
LPDRWLPCRSNTGQKDGAHSPSGGKRDCKIALLLPENTTPRYEAADKPYFEASVRAKGADLYRAVLQRGQRRQQACPASPRPR